MNTSTEATSPLAPRNVAAAFYEAFVANDLGAAAASLHPNVVLHVPGDHPVAGDYHGLAGILDFIGRNQAVTGGGENVELIDVLGGHQYAAAYCFVTGTRPDDAPLRNHTVHLLRVVDGQIVEVWFHNRDQAAVDRFWSAAPAAS